MYNRYIPQGDFLPVEDLPPEQDHSAPASKQESGASGGILSWLLGGGKSLSKLSEKGSGLLGSLGLGKLDKSDILLLLVLIYLFKESEDDEWLIILALVLLMGL